MKRVIIFGIGLLFMGCQTPKQIVDATNVTSLYIDQQYKDTEIIVEYLIKSAEEEQARGYLNKLAEIEQSIKENKENYSVSEAITEFTKVQELIYSEIKKAEDYYEGLKVSILKEIKGKTLRSQQILQKIKEYQQSGRLSNEAFKEIADSIGTVGVEALSKYNENKKEKEQAKNPKEDINQISDKLKVLMQWFNK